MKVIDDRTDAEAGWPMVVATDRLLSGWGQAHGGASYAAWACHPDHLDRVYNWVFRRGDMLRVREVCHDYRPGPRCAHLHIYVARDDHPAVGR